MKRKRSFKMLNIGSEKMLKYIIDNKMINQPISNEAITQVSHLPLEASYEIISELISHGYVEGELLDNKAIIYRVTDTGIKYFQ
jgi:hypothetical protein